MGLEILENNENGYHPLVKFGAWRVAVANPCDKWVEGKVTFMERNMKTDEVFVLLRGGARLYVEETVVDMEPGVVYNVAKGEWHHIVVTPDASVLVVENSNTSLENTERRKI
jgi:mannose-6-phosphate isomerase-like protein (cupin superfamily)